MTLPNRATCFTLGTTPGGNRPGSRRENIPTPQRTVKLPRCGLLRFFLAHFIERRSKLRAAMDATRKQDSLLVTLKKVLPEEGPHELRINELFSSEEHARNHDNHCAPLLDAIELSTQFGSQKLMVFPLLRPFNQPCVQTFGEFVAFFTQICEARLNFR